MATRANVVIRSTGRTYWLYHHWDGYPSYLGWHLGCFLMGNKDGIDSVATQLVKGAWEDGDGFELTNFRHLDIEWLYEVNLEQKKMLVYRAYPFDEIQKADLMFEFDWTSEKSAKKFKDFCEKN